jgi:hypothetical protein
VFLKRRKRINNFPRKVKLLEIKMFGYCCQKKKRKEITHPLRLYKDLNKMVTAYTTF